MRDLPKGKIPQKFRKALIGFEIAFTCFSNKEKWSETEFRKFHRFYKLEAMFGFENFDKIYPEVKRSFWSSGKFYLGLEHYKGLRLIDWSLFGRFQFESQVIWFTESVFQISSKTILEISAKRNKQRNQSLKTIKNFLSDKECWK